MVADEVQAENVLYGDAGSISGNLDLYPFITGNSPQS